MDTDLCYLPDNPSVPVGKVIDDGDNIIFLNKKKTKNI